MNVNRYSRQVILPDFGISAQEKLAASSVLVVGAGGLGCPALQLLVSSGIGKIGIVDFDFVEIQNLHRQFLFDEKDIGLPKVIVAERYLKSKNPETEIEIFNEKLTAQNGIGIIQNYDVVADCTDNFTTRYLLNDACFILKKPLVYASIFRYEGQVAVFNVEKENQITNYRDLFPVPPNQNEVPNCNEAGVLPTHSSVIGTFQANEVIKLLTGSGDILIHKLLTFNTKNYQSMVFNFNGNEKKSGPNTIEELQNFNYEEFCHIYKSNEITSLTGLEIFLDQEKSILIDVREPDEQPRLESLQALEIPLASLGQHLESLKPYDNICFVCASGIRSRKAMELIKNHFPEKEIRHFPSGAKSIVQ
ncbi:ThiF family adenylyltransferase [Chryseobacterium sp. SSA4.19]|uniref:ThiF family adenylyltransferase n=1 Tax=Chryseobacterium sp. SSA4.19 TaxID=2919915 RepID=UPI001F4EBEC2|nr:ThiF family adenylyltransferase [Chryseobacterium sp. SSA4.19]MCJ8154558.1 ThiF family adenylyltransferase [Chryseobacterium sp. SSA4.19]